jgi:ABC-type transport system involved in cytochrome c biogenesis permease component
MNGLRQHLGLSLRLHFRNRMALLYGYLFPLIFLVAFWVLYRHEKIPLIRHMGELLTVSVLGGACFGLPTTLVSERERGVWRRYRLTPLPSWAFVVSTALARYVIILSAGALQLGLALCLGMPLPAHPLDLWVAFTLVSFAFIGLGLVLAMLADNVPAVQALGQCIFLPMLIIGGVAVQLASLPTWAQHVSAFFPGRYAVEALQACVSGDGLGSIGFCLLALALIGVAGCSAGAKLFRWDAAQRFAASTGKGWLLPVLGSWLAVGLLAEWRDRIAVSIDGAPVAAPVVVVPPPAPLPPWTKITAQDVAALDFRVPSDGGVVSPFAGPEEEASDYTKDEIEAVRQGLLTWRPGLEGDDVQRVRNLVCVAAVPDAIQLPSERYLPPVVLSHLQEIYPKDKLIKILTWIVQHPEDGSVLDSIADLGVQGTAGDPYVVRERSYLYSLKFILRLTDRIEH